MRGLVIFMIAVLLAPAAGAQSRPAKDLRPLFDAIQKSGIDSELRGDIADRLGFGEDPLVIKDMVVTVNGVQHAANAFRVSGKPYILFDSHLHVPEVYIFVKDISGAMVAGFHGRQYQPLSDTIDMLRDDSAPVVGAEEAFWAQWLADGAKAPPT